MSALAYVLLPVSGLIAYLKGSTARTRFHGLQAISIGLLWPVALYVCARVASAATIVCFVVGALVWVVLGVATALGADPRIPLLGAVLERIAAADPRATGEV